MPDVPLAPLFRPADSRRPQAAATERGRQKANRGAGRHRWLALGALAGDLVSGTIALAMAAGVVNAVGDDQVGIGERVWTWMPDTLLLLIGMSCSLGLYSSSARSLIERFRLRLIATLLFVFAGMLMSARDGLSLGLAAVPLVGAMALVLSSWFEHMVNARLAVWGASAAVLGTGPESRKLAHILLSQPVWGLKPVGFVDDCLRSPDVDGTGSEGAGASEGNELLAALPLLGSIEGGRLEDAVDVVIVPDCRALPRDPDALYRLGVRQIMVVGQVGPFASFGLQIRHFDRFVGLEIGGRPRPPSQTLKRAIDLAVAVPLALLTAPLIALLALVIRTVDPGPIFYGQQRVGRHGKSIRVLKLRTMYRDAEQRLEQVLADDAALRAHWQRYFKLPRDPRILPYVGSFLRRTSLDELPQLWNIIRGDMSLVGPRPFPAYHMDAFDMEFRALRQTVPPGLTGLWQVSARSSGDLGVQRAQDCFYIRNRSLWLDLYILVATLPAVLIGRGAR